MARRRNEDENVTHYKVRVERDISFRFSNLCLKSSSISLGSKWRRTDLTYRISQYPSKLNLKRSDVDNEIARAFRVWSEVTPLNFHEKKTGRVHIDIRFESGEHGDGDPFDGPGNTLAHAYFPQYGGDAHFDNEEHWTVSSHSGIERKKNCLLIHSVLLA